jgi:3-hydroxyethyl bacteriochlorophyllide a dehydrogenase
MQNALAIVLESPEHLSLSRLDLDARTEDDVVVETAWSGISTGTERLLYRGRMPDFPGMGYPLVPGYETVGTIIEAGSRSHLREGQMVFVPGARCFGPVRGLFGGAASHLISPASRIVPVSENLGEKAILIALAATAYHARAGANSSSPNHSAAGQAGDLIIGHGVLGRLLARLSVIEGGEPPTVWETNPARIGGGTEYAVCPPEHDPRRDRRIIFDVSGDATLLDTLISRLAPGGEIVLAGFYEAPLAFTFPPAFMREARIRVAAQWRESDLLAVTQLIETGALSLDGLITHRSPVADAAAAYPIAFNDPECLKMVIDWRQSQ